MQVLKIEVAKHKNLEGAFVRAMRRDPDKIIFIGSAPEYERRARESGHEVEVYAASDRAPDGAITIEPLP